MSIYFDKAGDSSKQERGYGSNTRQIEVSLFLQYADVHSKEIGN